MMTLKQQEIIRERFSIKEKRMITPHYIRVIFEIPQKLLPSFRNVTVGIHNKIFVSANGKLGEADSLLNAEGTVYKRTYTTRHIDFEKSELWIDFIAHGDNGPASAWVTRAQPGEELEIAMKEGKRTLVPDAACYLIIGDATALPVIATILEQIPATSKATVVLEVYDSKDEQPLSSKAEIKTEWIHNSTPEKGSNLADYVKALPIPTKNNYVFIATEYDTVKQLKTYFKDTLEWVQQNLYAVSYWKRGASEDESDDDRKQERRS